MRKSAQITDIDQMSKKVIVIGAGAAGLAAACAAADSGADVSVLEQNEKAGKKIYITGKGRCNFTNACPVDEFFDHVVNNPKFLYSAIYDYDQSAVMNFMEQNGCPYKIERGNRVFPVSDHASDVTKCLTGYLKKRGGRIRLHTKVQRLLCHSETVRSAENLQDNHQQRIMDGVRLSDGRVVHADAVIVATGGLSYPSTGATGDGFRFAKEAGLLVTPGQPSLVPFNVRENWPMTLQGLSLRNVAIQVTEKETSKEPDYDSERKNIRRRKNKPVFEGFGEMLFTHFGVSGPLILSASTRCDFHKHPEGFVLHLDLKPALSQEQLTERMKREFEHRPQMEFGNCIRSFFPARMAEVMAQLSGLDPARRARTINEREMSDFAALMKNVPITLVSTRGFQEAIITRGGVNVKEINPSTMECRKVKGLYFAGEVIDVDAVTGGFNLQIAFSTGHLAGISAARTDTRN